MLTMEEIENISFRRSGMGGYKVEDVDTFVDGVIEKVRQLELANKELEARVDDLNKQVIRYESQAESVQAALITAQKTAKQLVKEASAEAEGILRQARTQADDTTRQADEQAADVLSAAQFRAQTVLDGALSRSAAGIEENNRIIEQQKQHIIQIQNEVSRFRDALIDSYKNHLELINSLPQAEEFQRYQDRLDEKYPMAEPVDPAAMEEEVWQEADQAVAEAKQPTQIHVELVDADKVKAISEEMRAAPEQEQDDAPVRPQTMAPEETLELPKLPHVPMVPLGQEDDSADSNLDEIQAAVQREKLSAAEDSEPKPMSIDEIGDGRIFGAEEPEPDRQDGEKPQPPAGTGKHDKHDKHKGRKKGSS